MSDENPKEVSGEPVDFEGIADRFAAFMKNVRTEGEIPYPINVERVELLSARSTLPALVGRWCSVRVVSDDKTYLGVYLGDLMREVGHIYNVETEVLSLMPRTNPALWVPDLGRIVWGIESWWGVIEHPEQLRQITDADIENVWYVRALRDLENEAKRDTDSLHK